MKSPIPLIFLVLSTAAASAAPVISLEVSGVPRSSGAILRLASDGVVQVTDPIAFTEPMEPITVSFPNVVPGDYYGQVSFGDEIYSDATSLIAHPAAGTLSFTHDPGAVVNVSYRLLRVIEDCAEITIRNTGDMPLTGIAANLIGADFSVDTTAMATSLNPGETTTVTVCVTATDQNEHLGSLEITGNAAPFTLALIGDNDPGPIQVAPVITVFTDRTPFETSITAPLAIDGFSNSTPSLPVTTLNGGTVSGGKWNDIARDPEPSTVWEITDGTTAWGGTWDLTVSGTGGGLAFELDFGGGNIVPVPGQIPSGSLAGYFFGFTASQPFFAVRVRQIDSAGNTLQETHSFDDMTYQLNPTGEMVVFDGPTSASSELADGQAAVLDFGTTPKLTSIARTFTVENTSAAPLWLFSVSGSDQFQISNAPTFPIILAIGESVNFDVVFSSPTSGSFEQAIQILSSDGDESPFDFAVRAESVPSGEMVVFDGPTNASAELVDGQAALLDLGTTTHGNPITRTFTVENTSAEPLWLFSVSGGDRFQISNAPAFPLALATGESVNFDVVFSSSTSGTFEQAIQIVSSDDDESPFDFTVRASVPYQTEIALTSELDGADIVDGQTAAVESSGNGSNLNLLLSNLGFDPLIISSISVPPGFAFTLAGTSDLPRAIPGLSPNPVLLQLTVTDPTPGLYEGLVTITSNDLDEGEFTFPVRVLSNLPEISVVNTGFFGSTQLTNGGTLDVGTTRLGQPNHFTLRVTNLHPATLKVEKVTLPAGYQLAATAPTFPLFLGQNLPRDIPITIISTTAGTFSGTLSIENNDFDESPFNIQLTGTVSPESILFFGFNTSINEGGSFGAFASGSGPVTYEWDLDDDGDFDDATGSTIALPDTDGPSIFPVSLRMTDNLTTMIRTASIPVNNRVPTINGGFIDRAIAGTPLELDLSASDIPADTAAGMTWRIDWGDGSETTTPAGHPATATFSHTFAQPGGTGITIEATDKDGGMGSTFRSVWVHSAVIGVFDGPDTSGTELRDGEASLFFSTLAGGNEDRQLTVLNRSASPASVGPVSLPEGYVLVAPPTFPATIAPGATLTLTLRFAPPSGGDFNGTFALSTSDPAMPSFEIALSGFAASPDIAVNEFFSGGFFDFASDTLSFQISPGTEEFNGLTFTIESVNFDAPLVIQSIDLPPGFQLAGDPEFPIVFESDSSTDIRIQCSAATDGSADGFYKGWVSIVSNDPDESPFRFFITSRVGDVPDLRVSSVSDDSSSAEGLLVNGQGGSPELPLQLWLGNRTIFDLTVSNVSLPTGFAFASPPSFPISLDFFGSTVLPEIVLTATEPGTYSGQVVIESTDPDENQFSFAISATIPGGTGPALALGNPVIRPAGPGVLAGVSGMIVGGQPNGTAFVEASVDLGQLDAWRVIATVPLDENGEGVFGDPVPVEDAQSTGSDTWFVRVRQ